jgi:glycosyltransferase involved in cell wall biosynthesis
MNNAKKTLIILTPGFPASETDSTCLPLQQSFVKTIKQKHPELNLVVLSFQYPYHTNEYTWQGIPVIPFCGKNKGGIARLLLRKKICSKLAGIAEQTSIAGMISFWYGECALIGHRFSKKIHARHLCWILGQDARINNKYPHRVNAPANELVALSDFIQIEFEKNHGIRPMHIIPPGLDTQPVNNVERSIDVLAAGSLIPLKNYDVFIRVVFQLKKIFPALKAVLIGDGPEKQRLQNIIKGLKLEDTIQLTGEISHEKVEQLMAGSKLFLHPSSYEGFGMVCLEALKANAKVISFVQPMNQQISNWFHVQTEEEMKNIAAGILSDYHVQSEPVLPFLIEDTVEKFMSLVSEPL